VTEAELNSGIECAQDMLYAMRVLESIGQKVQKPMKLYIDNKSRLFTPLVVKWKNASRMCQIEFYPRAQGRRFHCSRMV
jgi:hypothetical protein